MDDASIDRYHEYMIGKDAISMVIENGRLLGYVAYYRINFEQLGRLVCQLPFNALEEDIVSGNILYLIDVTIDPEYRGTHVYKQLRDMLFSKNADCEFFIGHAIYKKRSQPIRVFKRTEIMKKYQKELVTHG
jgi:hypothetical protein